MDSTNESPGDYVCDVCGSDDVGGITEAWCALNNNPKYALVDWADSFMSYACGNCADHPISPILRSEYADEKEFDGPWAVVNYRVVSWKPRKTEIVVKVYHPNGERVATWEGDAMDNLQQTAGPPSLKLEDIENLDLAYGLCAGC